MNCCGHCQDAGYLFDEGKAERERRKYRKKGPSSSTRKLLKGIRSADISISESTLLDVGSGVGAIPLELFKKGLRKAVNVDASQAYIEASQKEAEREGVRDRTEYHFGDVVDLAPSLPKADIVTLDRVICCYPEPEKLIPATAGRSTHCYGVVYPRERWISRLGMWVGNQWFRLRGKEFRVYLFSPRYIGRLIREQGFRLSYTDQTFLWHVEIYMREEKRK